MDKLGDFTVFYTDPDPNPAQKLDVVNNWQNLNEHIRTAASVADPWHFEVDPDPDPRIHASDQGIRILLFSSLTFKMPTKN
jgi:hypothetical protein